VDFRRQNAAEYPHFYNGAVPSFGEISARLLVVGLAPGLKGANATGRPFTGDFAGEMLYPALMRVGLAAEDSAHSALSGAHLKNYALSPPPHDYQPTLLALKQTRISNAVRCVPPENKPLPAEIKQCNHFLQAEIAAMPNLAVILALGQVAHQAVLQALGMKRSHYPFAHGAAHRCPTTPQSKPCVLVDSYHTSRYNVNTNRLKPAAFDAIMQQITGLLQDFANES
jgi:uracil-DNA glycosylase family 4